MHKCQKLRKKFPTNILNINNKIITTINSKNCKKSDY